MWDLARQHVSICCERAARKEWDLQQQAVLLATPLAFFAALQRCCSASAGKHYSTPFQENDHDAASVVLALKRCSS